MNQYALESVVTMIPLLKNGFVPVLFSVVTIVMDNLNSKNSGIYSAAIKVLDTMITYLGNGYLLARYVYFCVCCYIVSFSPPDKKTYRILKKADCECAK